VESARIGLAIGLDLLGVSAPETLEQLERFDDDSSLATSPASSLDSGLGSSVESSASNELSKEASNS
jgi:hypothetical protein